MLRPQETTVISIVDQKPFNEKLGVLEIEWSHPHVRYNGLFVHIYKYFLCGVMNNDHMLFVNSFELNSLANFFMKLCIQ